MMHRNFKNMLTNNNLNLIHVGDLFPLSDMQDVIDAAQNLRTHVHVYGNQQIALRDICWLTYNSYQGSNGNLDKHDGQISFSRNTYEHPKFKELIDSAIYSLTKYFSPHLIINPYNVHLLKTKGNIYKHRDENVRKSCINIGLINSSKSITRISNDDNFENFDKNNTQYCIKENNAYLLNTSVLHSVEGDNNIDRYLLTCSFNIDFEKMKSYLI